MRIVLDKDDESQTYRWVGDTYNMLLVREKDSIIALIVAVAPETAIGWLNCKIGETLVYEVYEPYQAHQKLLFFGRENAIAAVEAAIGKHRISTLEPFVEPLEEVPGKD